MTSGRRIGKTVERVRVTYSPIINSSFSSLIFCGMGHTHLSLFLFSPNSLTAWVTLTCPSLYLHLDPLRHGSHSLVPLYIFTLIPYGMGHTHLSLFISSPYSLTHSLVPLYIYTLIPYGMGHTHLSLFISSPYSLASCREGLKTI